MCSRRIGIVSADGDLLREAISSSWYIRDKRFSVSVVEHFGEDVISEGGGCVPGVEEYGLILVDKDFPSLSLYLEKSIPVIYIGCGSSFSKPIRLRDLIEVISFYMREVYPLVDSGFFDYKKRVVYDKNVRISVTEKEAEILRYLIISKLRNKNDLLRNVWGYHPDSLTTTVESHMWRLRRKLTKISVDLSMVESLGDHA